MSHEHISLIEIHSQELAFDKKLDSEGVERWIRSEYPGIQVRTCGLGCRDFPHPKRIPYVSLGLDGCGTPIFATRYYIKHNDVVNPHEKVSKVKVYSKDLVTDRRLSAEELERKVREKYRGIQVRKVGPTVEEFPHQKRIPYVSIWISHLDKPNTASVHYLE